MDASDVFRHIEGLGAYQPRFPHAYQPPPPPPPPNVPLRHGPPRDDHGEGEGSHRIAHTLTACCRCRQRKTRCDPALPRCLPCERSGSICEYFDTTKGKKISRQYVVRLQERVRTLEAELGQYTDEDDLPRDHEAMVRPGGLVRLNETDETPRYLGPSSGIAMTRIVMDEAKRYTDSQRISQLIPELRVRRQAAAAGPASAVGMRSQSFSMRSQSFSMPPSAISQKKSYPMISAVPAEKPPTRGIADKLFEVYYQRGQVFAPVLHEKKLAGALDDFYSGSQDPYQQFIVRMVFAISMQKLDTTYAGLADSYYISAMRHFEDVVRPKDLKTLQCLLLIGQYSLLTPTRTAVYFVIGLATRICQQLGLGDEKTIALGVEDALTLDMRRRLSWIVTSMELGLAYSMGRPNGFAKSDDLMDVKFFDSASDENITENGILSGPPDEKKLVAIHFCKMRLCQSEIRRILYEKKQPEPRNEHHPWFAAMEEKLDQWLSASPAEPAWCKPWFTGRYHTMVVALYRPSPQVPKPSSRAALKCFDSASFIVTISSKQMMASAIDITWVFVSTLYMALNTILWSVASYPEVRSVHQRDEVEELVNITLDMLDQCAERWPGAAAASELYGTFAKACLQSYEAQGTPTFSTASLFGTPPAHPEVNSSPSTSEVSKANGPSPFNPPQFGYVWDSAPEQISFVDNPFGGQPSFRSNSIFHNPASNEHPGSGRRFSYFPPDFTQPGDDILLEEMTPPAESNLSPPLRSPPNHLPTPPESVPAGAGSTPLMSTPLLPTSNMTTPLITHTSPVPHPTNGNMHHHQPPQRGPTFTIPHHAAPNQRPLPPPTTVTDWFNPPAPFIAPYAFGGGSGGEFWAGSNGGGNGGNGLGVMNYAQAQFQGLRSERQGSLTHAQQMELMGVLENEGMTDIDTYLSMGANYGPDMMGNGLSSMNWGHSG